MAKYKDYSIMSEHQRKDIAIRSRRILEQSKLSKDKSEFVRLALIQNPNLAREILYKLSAHDPSKFIRRQAELKLLRSIGISPITTINILRI